MNKKNIFVFIIFIVFVVSIVVGNSYWNKKVMSATKQTEEVKTGEVKKAKEEKLNLNENYIKNLPETIKEKLRKAASGGEPVHLVIIGDHASFSEKDAWPEKLKSNLEETYGKKLWKVTAKEYKDESSEELMAKNRDKEIIELKPDVILFQAPFITDNNKIGNGNSVANTQKFIRSLSNSMKDVTVMIQPPNPVYNAKNYPKAVEALKQFTIQNDYTYINHWEAWPNSNTKDILSYLQDEFGFPNVKGQEVWAQYIVNYFIAKE
ncbi:TPA: SGNH/GDSL hydrolase family protein [Bacillus anthracis]|nr:SGNH/GDSL hydrolase family protein [Bacillus anthracis]